MLDTVFLQRTSRWHNRGKDGMIPIFLIQWVFRIWMTLTSSPRKYQIQNHMAYCTLRQKLISRNGTVYRTTINKVSAQGSSTTLRSCVVNDPLNLDLVTIITTIIDGYQVQGACSMSRTFYHIITDPSPWLISFQKAENDRGVDSLLNSNENIYFRSASHNTQSSAS